MQNSSKTIFERLKALFAGSRGGGATGSGGAVSAAVTAQVDDSLGWSSGRQHDNDPSKNLELYQDALTAWRKNPIAWRIIGITTDYVVGDKFQVSSPNR